MSESVEMPLPITPSEDTDYNFINTQEKESIKDIVE